MITILFLSSNPQDTDRLAIDEEYRDIEQRLRSSEYRDNFDIKSHWAVRVSDLQQLFLRYRPNIVHFSGHGSVQSEITLQDDLGLNQAAPPKALSDLFSKFSSSIKCVVLNACYTQQQAEAIADHIDCVIGMSDTLTDQSAKAFSCAFYQALGYGESVQRSFELGCNQIQLSGLEEHQIPVFICNVNDPSQITFATKPVISNGADAMTFNKMREIREAFSYFIENEVLDKKIISKLLIGKNNFADESELWGYIASFGRDELSLADCVKQITGFHNAFGGYLIFGIDRTKKLPIVQSSEILTNQDVNLIKRAIENYIGESIEFKYKEFSFGSSKEKVIYGVLLVPKRHKTKTPLFMGKQGPVGNNSIPLFQKGEIFLRYSDTCIPATEKVHYQFLFSERYNEYLWDPSKPILEVRKPTIVIDHNLPNRSYICPKFFGRESELQELWKWLGDELSNTKVLAGDGGKGKTSIAYQFAEEICYAKPYNIEKVIWLTAKMKQFSPELDKYVNIPKTDFYDLETLLKATCSELAILDDEVQGASIPMLKKYMKKGLENILCLVVIDNVDSIDEDQQRQIFEMAMQFPGSRARFLLTTRINRLYSADQCITISGFNKKDYQDYVLEMISRFKCPPVSQTQINHMRNVSDGSPLFTESILRLYKNGTSFKLAVRNWQGKEGSEVRKAALSYEIEQLSIEAKRILLATAYMKEASITELRQVTGYTIGNIQKYIDELNSFFLLEKKPFIKKELRFTVLENTGRLVSEIAEQLVPSPGKLRTTIIKLRQRQNSDKYNRMVVNVVFSAINQARALSREGKYEDAAETIIGALRIRRNHPDLLLELGSIELDSYSQNLDSKLLNKSRVNLKKSYDYGQRSGSLFVAWFTAENLAKDYVSAIDVSSLALQQSTINRITWLKNRATAYSQLSRKMSSSLNFDLAVDNMKKAARDIGTAMRSANTIKRKPLFEMLSSYDDELWSLFSKKATTSLSEYVDRYDLAQFIIKVGDTRYLSLKRLCEALIEAVRFLINRSRVASSQINLVQNLQRQMQIIVAKEVKDFSENHQIEIEKLGDTVNRETNNLLVKFRHD